MPGRFETTQLAPRARSAFPSLETKSGPNLGDTSFAAPDRNGVMACIDGSAVGPTVFAHARALAHSLELPIAVAQVVEARKSSAAPRDPFEWQIICREGRSRLHHFAAVCGVVPEPVEEVLLHGSASEEINRWAKDNHVGFLVVATHRPSAGRTSLLGSTARRLLESGERSLLLIPPDVPAEANVRYRRLVTVRAEPRVFCLWRCV